MLMKDTSDVAVPKDPLERVIGQEKAVRMARVCASQGRHLLLIGPPGTGKSMIAQAIAFHLPKPKHEISVLHNPAKPERPVVEVRSGSEVIKGLKFRNLSPALVPYDVAEKLGFRCPFCGALSKADENVCPSCHRVKYSASSEFISVLESSSGNVLRNRAESGGEVFERDGDSIRVFKKGDLGTAGDKRKVIVPLERSTFIQATGASETELLGDVKHDPYGDNPEHGSFPYERVVPGAIHEAHEGVLFIDELPSLGALQRCILTAMQEKKYPISGRNPHSAGASVRVDGVPCDFILVGAINISDIETLLPPLRSRIRYGGYEVLVETTMADTKENREKTVQFIAQEIAKDGRIPHASARAVGLLLEESSRLAQEFDGAKKALTLRFRELGGIIRLAGDLAVADNSKLIEPPHIEGAVKDAASIEGQVIDKYGSLYRARKMEGYVKKEKSEKGVI